ncbi:hypothetical protein J6590_013621 [Homalodisca vitripennis]|nr:hypothetical protein J6590_013621 [Homalodisca vitripennis]
MEGNLYDNVRLDNIQIVIDMTPHALLVLVVIYTSSATAKRSSLTQPSDQRLKGDFRTTYNARQTGCFQGHNHSAVTRPSRIMFD